MLNLVEDPRSDHVREMALYFDAVLDEANDASTITMDNKKAKGFISSYRLFSGLSVWVYNITFLSDFKVDLDLIKDSPLYFCYNVEGNFFHRFGKNEEFANILQNQNMVARGGPKTSAQIIFPANEALKIAVVIVDKKLLGKQDIRIAKRIYSKVDTIFQGAPLDRPYRHIGMINSETQKYASIVCENKSVELVGGLLTEGAVLNMLASQIQAYSDDIAEITPKSNLSDMELSKITSIGTYVIDNIESGVTIQNLSKKFGLSPKKLQTGVKLLYGDSVGHYISNLRMNHAKNLLLTTDMNVSEVCHKVGFSSTSYFSKTFKNRYNHLPSLYKKAEIK